jgi:hypothetical protein
MTVNIEKYAPQTGRRIKEDSTTINIADIIDAIYDSGTGDISVNIKNTAVEPVITQMEYVAKGDTQTVITAGTGASPTTSSEFSIVGFNAMKVYLYLTGTGAWTLTVQDSSNPAGTFVNSYDNQGNLMQTPSMSASGSFLFVGLSDQCKIVATEDSGTATIQVDIVPLNV